MMRKDAIGGLFTGMDTNSVWSLKFVREKSACSHCIPRAADGGCMKLKNASAGRISKLSSV